MDDNNCKELMEQTVMDISTDQSTAIKQLKNRPPVDKPVYKSLEAFLFQNFPEGLEIDYKTHDRNPIQHYRRHLKKTLRNLGIDIQLFNREKSFYITQDVSDLFLLVLKSFDNDKDMLKRLKNEETARLYHPQLIELRNCLAYALESIKTPLDDFIQALLSFEKATNCPPLWSFVPHTNIVTEAVNYWKEDCDARLSDCEPTEETDYKTTWSGFDWWDCELTEQVEQVEQVAHEAMWSNFKWSDFDWEDYKEQLSDFQWIDFTRDIEYYFRDFWRPKFIEYVGSELRKRLQALKEGIPQDNPSEISKQEKSEL